MSDRHQINAVSLFSFSYNVGTIRMIGHRERLRRRQTKRDRK